MTEPVMCAADCGCAGGQQAGLCTFEPSCSRCDDSPLGRLHKAAPQDEYDHLRESARSHESWCDDPGHDGENCNATLVIPAREQEHPVEEAEQIIRRIAVGPETWTAAVPYLIALISAGSSEGRELARLEMLKMARLADAHREQLNRVSRATDDTTDWR